MCVPSSHKLTAGGFWVDERGEWPVMAGAVVGGVPIAAVNSNGEGEVPKDETAFSPVHQHTSRAKTREKRQAVNPLEFTDSVVCTAQPPPLIKSPGEWGSCVAAKGRLYITLLKVITEILN